MHLPLRSVCDNEQDCIRSAQTVADAEVFVELHLARYESEHFGYNPVRYAVQKEPTSYHLRIPQSGYLVKAGDTLGFARATQPVSGVASSSSTHYSGLAHHYIRGNEAERRSAIFPGGLVLLAPQEFLSIRV
jgi:hypothetical protein